MAGTLSHLLSLSFTSSNPSRRSSASRLRPMMVSVPQTQPYWASIDSEIEARLKMAILIRHPVCVFEPMRHLTFSAPRTTAASLCIAACELVGGSRDDAMEAAAAIQLMHAAAYAHEHLPLTDRARPKPSIRHEFGPNIELLTGDGMVPFGLELLARSADPSKNNAGKILRVIMEIARGAGAMVEGQYLEFELAQSGRELTERMCEKKEGSLHACGAACGAILGGGSEDEIEGLRKYGNYVGTIRGMLNGAGKLEGRKMEIVEKLRALAGKELEGFGRKKAEAIHDLVEACSLDTSSNGR